MSRKSSDPSNCSYCPHYSSILHECRRGVSESHKSYIDYECEKAVRDGLEIVVIYKSPQIEKDKCPDAVKYRGEHIAAYKYEGRELVYDYQAIAMEMMFL